MVCIYGRQVNLWYNSTSTPYSPAVKKLDQRVSELEDDVAWLEEYVFDWNEAVETYIYAFKRVVEEKLDVSFDSYLEMVSKEDNDGL